VNFLVFFTFILQAIEYFSNNSEDSANNIPEKAPKGAKNFQKLL